MGNDEIASYTGFRTISKGEVDGIVRPLLNGEFIFQFGTLDQGFWPDGLYTPPNREAMVFDLQTLKSLGFNMLRKHVGKSITRSRMLADLFRLEDQSRERFVLPSLRSDGYPSYTRHACFAPYSELLYVKLYSNYVSPRCRPASRV